MSATVVRGDATSIPLADESVDLIITSPPYFALREYKDGGESYDGQIGNEETPQDFLNALWTVTEECVRVLKPSGSLFVNLGDKYSGSNGASGAPSEFNKTASHVRQKFKGNFGGVPAKSLVGLPWRYTIGCIDQLGLLLRAEIIWNKMNCLPESAKDRVHRRHEQFFHFTKQGKYYCALDEVREPYKQGALDRLANPYYANDRVEAGISNTGQTNMKSEPNPLGAPPGSVWTLPMDPLRVPKHLGVEHFAAFPQEIVRRLILGWSPVGICVECGEGRTPVENHTVCSCTPYTEHKRPKEKKDLRGSTQRDLPQGQPRQSNATFNGEKWVNNFDGAKAPQEKRIWREYHFKDWDAPETREAVVLDPFGGTGTVAMVARALGRHGVSLDLSSDYCRLAKWRIFDSGNAAKSIAQTAQERQGLLL